MQIQRMANSDAMQICHYVEFALGRQAFSEKTFLCRTSRTCCGEMDHCR